MINHDEVNRFLAHETRRRTIHRAVTVVMVGLAFLMVSLLWNQITNNTRSISELQGMVKTQCKDSVPTTSRSRQICDKAESNQLPGPAGPAGINGQNGKNGKNGVDGTPGPAGSKGSDGKPGKAGPQGITGARGPAGRDGTSLDGPAGSPGPQGPQGNVGPQGPQGAQGSPGQDGRGVTSTQCVGGQWLITYSDGSTQTTGSCI